ncbi:cytochrome P450 [Coprinopsis cinerea AmutBmut pab1-1]|nr:cytochrome P450 [Coprinopsis cinerea AmutBmut pab1-1]
MSTMLQSIPYLGDLSLDSILNWDFFSEWLHSPGHATTRSAILVAIFTGTLLLRSAINRRKRNPRGLPLPPGPRRLPLVGNLFQIPSVHPWAVYDSWGKQYGDMIYLEAIGQPLMIINSVATGTELLEKRGTNYSDRPGSTPAFDILEFGWMIGLLNYGPEWTGHRRAFQQHLNPRKVHLYKSIIEEEGLVFLRRLLARPKDFMAEARLYFGMVLMRVSYGSTNAAYNADLIERAEMVAKGFSEAALPGKYLVNVLPFLKYVPAWFPGAGWKRDLLKITQVTRSLIHDSFDEVVNRVKSGKQSREYHSLAGGLIEDFPPESDPRYAEQEYIARCTAVATYVGGSDTTGGTSQALFVALATNPHFQKRAQAEMDAVLGPCQLPKPDDVARLPYIQALTKEILRWFVVAPFALPHVIKDDDEFRGHFLPKGTVIFPNLWAMLHDPNTFDTPMEFNPERYLKDGKINPNVVDSEIAAFGFGRRICPGRHLALDSLGYMIACLLAVFNVSLPKDQYGNPVPIDMQITSGMIAGVLPYECDIVPRSEQHAALVRDQ